MIINIIIIISYVAAGFFGYAIGRLKDKKDYFSGIKVGIKRGEINGMLKCREAMILHGQKEAGDIIEAMIELKRGEP